MSNSPPDINTKKAWNPVLILLITVLFTPLSGGIFHALNYGRLGQPHRVKTALVTNILIGLLIILLTFKFSDSLLFPIKFFLYALIVLTAIHFYRTQIELFKLAKRSGLKSAPWWQPILAGIFTSAVLISLDYGWQELKYIPLAV